MKDNKMQFISKKSSKDKKNSKAKAMAKAYRKENKYDTLRAYMWK